MTSTISTDDLLDCVGLGVRQDSWIWELLDGSRNVIGTLDVAKDQQTPHVRNDTTRSVFRTVTGLTISAADLSAIDVRHDRLRPSMLLQNGDRLPLGVFMFGDDNRTEFSWGETWTPAVFDETFIVDQPLAESVGIAPGGSMLGFLTALVDSVGLPDVDLSAITDAPAAIAMPYAAGTSRNQAIIAVAKALGCYPPFFNNNGTYAAKNAPASGQAADDTYELGGRVVYGTRVLTNSAYRAPNRYQVVTGNPSGGIVGIYDLPDSAPNSYANTGIRVVSTTTQQGIPTVALANLAAQINALTDRSAYTQMAWSSVADPRHDTFDLVDLYGTMCAEQSWEITCADGQPMTHTANGIFS